MGSVIYLAEKREYFRNKTTTSGIKAKSVFTIMNHLEKVMRDKGADVDQVMKFEAEFLESNGVIVPDSFWVEVNEYFESLEEFLEEHTEKADTNLKGSEFYAQYSVWVKKENKKILNKQECFDYLRNKNIMQKSATVDGRTITNVVMKTKLK